MGGIPDLCHRYQRYMDARKLNNIKYELDNFKHWSGTSVLLPFYPWTYMPRTQFWGHTRFN